MRRLFLIGVPLPSPVQKTSSLRLLIAAVLLLLGGSAVAQEPGYREDLRFVEALRARGDNDLALEFLKKLAVGAPADLLKELPLEFAKTELRVASDEPETAKRLALYKGAKENFQKFIDTNPTHPRVAEANVDIARVLNLQGKTELSRALLSDDPKTQRDLAAQARHTLELAAAKLQAALTSLPAKLKELPDPDGITEAQKKKDALAARTHLEDEIKQTEFEIGINLYDQSMTYLGGFGAEQASALLVKARDRLQPLTDIDLKRPNPISWKATAWVGRIMRETDTDDKAREKFNEAMTATQAASAEGRRLAIYFSLLGIHEKPASFLTSEADKKRGANAVILDRAKRWRAGYPRFLNTPEGIGVTFLLAQVLFQEADILEGKKNKAQADLDRNQARALLREVESSENEFTDRARRLKIQTIARQGTFKIPIAKLRGWEDLYIRAQFEASLLPQAPKEKRKEHIDSIIQALQLGMKTAEAKAGKAPIMELNTARVMLAFWLLNTGKLADAIEIAETFARNDPRSSQAEMASVYALQAYRQLLNEQKGRDEDSSETRAKLFLLAQYMEDRWAKGTAGEVARHTVGLLLLVEGNYAEGIKKLSLISPSYGNYAVVRAQLGEYALKADAESKAAKDPKDAIEPIPGDRPGDYLKRGLAALESMPESALGADPSTNQVVVAGKAKLGRMLFSFKRYQQMSDLANGLLARLDKLPFNEDPDKDKAIRAQLRYELVDVTLFANYGLASAAVVAGDHAKAAAILDPIVDQASKEEQTQIKFNLQKSPQLATLMLSIALNANIQLGKIDRTDLVLDVLDKVSAGEGGEAKTTDILKLLAHLIRKQVEEVRKKGDTDELKKAVTGYSSILKKRIDKQAKKKELSADFTRVLADCYSSMDDHTEAARLLKTVPDPKAAPDTPEGKTYRAVQLTRIRELRMSKTADGLKEARQVLDGILGTEKKPNWGRKDFFALQAHGLLLEDEEKYSEGFAHWMVLVKNLNKVAGRGAKEKEFYLEAYYHMVYCYLKNGLSKPGKEDREKAYHQAGVKIFDLEQNWEDFGSDASKKRFTELLASEPALKEQYELAKAKKKKKR